MYMGNVSPTDKGLRKIDRKMRAMRPNRVIASEGRDDCQNSRCKYDVVICRCVLDVSCIISVFVALFILSSELYRFRFFADYYPC